MHDAWQSVPTTLTVLTNVCAGDAHILLDKYVNMEFFLIFSPLSLQLFNIACPVKLTLLLFNRGQLRSSVQLPRQLIN